MSDRMYRVAGILLFSVVAISAVAQEAGERWLRNSGYGVMFHYQVFNDLSPAEYNRTINSFDVERWADSIESAGAGYVIFAIGQNWGKYCAPNSAYERLLGVENGVWTSKRDLIKEIGQALQDRDIRLIVYCTARAPMRHYNIIKAMEDALPTMNGKVAPPSMPTMGKKKGFVRSEHQPPPSAFLKNWGDVFGEWSMRYKDLVDGWWIDGYKRAMVGAYEELQKEPHNIDTWVAAIRSGNPKVEIAFNAGAYPGAALCTDGKLCPHQTYTAGEGHGFIREFKGQTQILTPKNFPSPDGVVWHFLFPLSDGWGAGTAPKDLYTADYLITGIDEVNAQGGAVTLDIPCAADGTIPPAVLARLRELAKVRDKLTDGKMSYPGIKVDTHRYKPTAKVAPVKKPVVQQPPRVAAAVKGKTFPKYENAQAVGQWSPKTMGKPLTVDVSSVIKQSGTYQFAFVYSKGQNGTEINSVALYNGSKKVAQDTHAAFSGGHLRDVVYSLKLPAYDPKGTYTIKAEIKGSGGNDSFGDVRFVGRK